MKTTFILLGAAVAIAVMWLILSALWIRRQTLIGSWIVTLPGGSQAAIRFDGERKGGLYKQLSEKDGTEIREFGHWTLNLTELRLLMMASDETQHPRFGVDTQYWVIWEDKNRVVIDGPDRPKWALTRATGEVEIDFELASPGEQAAAPNGGPEPMDGLLPSERPPSVS